MERESSVAVVIPTHRRPELLRRALRSAVTQSLPPIEIVVVDDARDDEARLCVQRVSEREGVAVRYIQNSGGTGVSSSRNEGVKASTATVVALLDDDDYWAPTYLARAVSRLHGSSVDAVVTWRADGVEGSLRKYRNPCEGLTVRQVVAANPGVVGSNVVIRRRAYWRIAGFDEGLPVSTDVDFFVRFLDAGLKYAVVDAPLVMVGNPPGPRLTAADRRRVDGLQCYLAKHCARMTLLQRLSVRRRIVRAALRMRRDASPRGVRRIAYTAGVLALSRPQDGRDVARVMALLREL